MVSNILIIKGLNLPSLSRLCSVNLYVEQNYYCNYINLWKFITLQHNIFNPRVLSIVHLILTTKKEHTKEGISTKKEEEEEIIILFSKDSFIIPSFLLLLKFWSFIKKLFLMFLNFIQFLFCYVLPWKILPKKMVLLWLLLFLLLLLFSSFRFLMRLHSARISLCFHLLDLLNIYERENERFKSEWNDNKSVIDSSFFH